MASITVGGFVAFNTYMVQLTWPVIALGWVINIFQRGTASMGRINEILVETPEIQDAAPNPQAPAIVGTLSFEFEFCVHRDPGSAQCEFADSGRGKSGNCRTHRFGQDDAGQPDSPDL